MKRIILPVLLCVCTLSVFRGAAAEATADNVSIHLLKEWASEKYGCKISKDGDLILNANDIKIAVTVAGKAKLIRLRAFYFAYKKRSLAETHILANKFNDEKCLMRVCVKPTGDTICDYYIVYNGGLNSTNFLEALNWFTGLLQNWSSYLVNGGDSE